MTTKKTKMELQADDIVKIIKACADHGIAELKFGDLQVVRPRIPEWLPLQNVSSSLSHPDTEISEAEIHNKEKEELKRSVLEFRHQQLDEMPLTDPVAFEEALASGDLTDERVESNDEA